MEEIRSTTFPFSHKTQKTSRQESRAMWGSPKPTLTRCVSTARAAVGLEGEPFPSSFLAAKHPPWAR